MSQLGWSVDRYEHDSPGAAVGEEASGDEVEDAEVVMRESELEELLDAARQAERARCVRIVVEESREIAGELCGKICAEIDESG